MTGIFLVEGMTLRSTKKGPNRSFREYLQQQNIKLDDTIKICACKGANGNGRTTAITLKDVIGADRKHKFYLGLTDNTDTMEKAQWLVYELDPEKLEESFRDRYRQDLGESKDLSLLNTSKKNYRINVGWSNAESIGTKNEELSYNHV